MIKKNFFLLLSYMKKSKMSNHGGRPPYVFAEFITPVRQIMINKNNCLAVCNGCISKKGFQWAKDHCNGEKNKVSNTVSSIGKHIKPFIVAPMFQCCSNSIPIIF